MLLYLPRIKIYESLLFREVMLTTRGVYCAVQEIELKCQRLVPRLGVKSGSQCLNSFGTLSGMQQSLSAVFESGVRGEFES
jgi:hypothetical protein